MGHCHTTNKQTNKQPAAYLRSAPYSAAILYTSCILVGIFINSSVPIFFELFIETVYPVPEGITCGVVTFLGNLFTGLLLFFLSFYCTGESAPLHVQGGVFTDRCQF